MAAVAGIGLSAEGTSEIIQAIRDAASGETEQPMTWPEVIMELDKLRRVGSDTSTASRIMATETSNTPVTPVFSASPTSLNEGNLIAVAEAALSAFLTQKPKETSAVTFAQTVKSLANDLLDRVDHALQAAISGTFPPDLLETQTLRTFISTTRATLLPMGLDIAATTPAEILALPTAFLPRGDGLSLYTKIPIYPLARKYHLYKHIPTPFVLGGSFATLGTPERILAISATGDAHTELTPLTIIRLYAPPCLIFV
jgi:hypothetical protein